MKTYQFAILAVLFAVLDVFVWGIAHGLYLVNDSLINVGVHVVEETGFGAVTK